MSWTTDSKNYEFQNQYLYCEVAAWGVIMRICQVRISIVLGLLKIMQYFVVSPSRISVSFPNIIVFAVATYIKHVVQDRGSAHYFAPRPVTFTIHIAKTSTAYYCIKFLNNLSESKNIWLKLSMVSLIYQVEVPSYTSNPWTPTGDKLLGLVHQIFQFHLHRLPTWDKLRLKNWLKEKNFAFFTNKTLHWGSSVSRLAMTAPAEPAPIIIKSYSL